nr:potassium channel family protein [Actinomycetes bacterium]
MANPLLAFWHRLFVVRPAVEPVSRRRVDLTGDTQASSTIFLILRRMRTPLVALIVVFAVSVLGLTLIPGQDANGQPWRMTFFDALYFMSYTATTIGFGEIPYTFSVAQRMWVTASIYLAVVGWAYAVGYLLALLQDRGFRQALATQRFGRQVGHLREPFLLMAGYGRTGSLVGRSLDATGQRFTVIDLLPDRIDALDLESYRADVPGLAADAGMPTHLALGGLNSPRCRGVLALTNDDEANLAVVMSTAMLRPDLPVIARALSPGVARRMRAFGSPLVVNPYDDFGDQLRVALRAPATYQLTQWLTSPPGTDLPERREPPPRGRWVVAADTRFGREVMADLRADNLPVSVVEVGPPSDDDDLDALIGPEVAGAAGFVAGADDDLVNLATIGAARRTAPG